MFMTIDVLPCCDSYEKSYNAVHDEQPLPAEKTANTPQLQEPAGHQSTHSAGNVLQENISRDSQQEISRVRTWTPQNQASRVASSVLL